MDESWTAVEQSCRLGHGKDPGQKAHQVERTTGFEPATLRPDQPFPAPRDDLNVQLHRASIQGAPGRPLAISSVPLGEAWHSFNGARHHKVGLLGLTEMIGEALLRLLAEGVDLGFEVLHVRDLTWFHRRGAVTEPQ